MSNTFRDQVVTLAAHTQTMNAFGAAENDGRADELKRELETLFTSQNKSSSAQSTSIPATFLRVTVSR